MESEAEAPAATAAADETLDYEGALGALDGVLAALEDGRVPLEEAIALYERGMTLVRRCSTLLSGAERRISELALDSEGSAVGRPFQPPSEEEQPIGGG